jgi:prepilin-type N-terminal cleavage/methylation domain-containing protein
MKALGITNTLNKQRAFTLAEILVVIAILGLLATIIFTITSGTREQGKIAKGLYFSQHLHNSLGSYAAGIWSFDEGSGATTSDTSGWGNNGTLVNSPTWRCAGTDTSYTPSAQGCSLEFNGSSNYVDAGNGTGLNINGDKLTLEAWGKNTGTTGTYQVTVRKNNSYYLLGITPAYDEYYIYLWTSVQRWDLFTGISPVPYQNKWTHFVQTYDGSKVKLYINGELVKDMDASGTVSISGDNLIIGALPGSYYWKGFLDQVKIYNTALTSVQIQSQYYVGLERLLGKGLMDEEEYKQKLAMLL